MFLFMTIYVRSSPVVDSPCSLTKLTPAVQMLSKLCRYNDEHFILQ